MEIQIPNTNITVSLSGSQQRNIAVQYLRERFVIPPRSFIKDGKLIHVATYRTTHGWDEEEFLRTATELDKQVINIINELNKQ